MPKPKDTARINAANIKNYSNKTFSDLYTNPGVIFFGSEDDMKALKKRAKELQLKKQP